VSGPYRFIPEADVARLLDLERAIAALEDVLAEEGRGEAVNVPKALHSWDPRSSMHSLGSRTASGYAGYKSWVNTPGGATAIYALWRTADGALMAVMEAATLGQFRTAAIAGVATRWLAEDDADDMALIGTGRQAMGQVAAVAAVRNVRRVRVFSPTAERRAEFCRRLAAAGAFDVVDAGSVEEALAGAPIVTLITRAKDPFLSADMLAPGAHLNAMGAILPGNAEFTRDVLDAADVVEVDDIENARRGSRELVEYFGEGEWKGVGRLGRRIAQRDRRPAGARLTVFKGMGMGLSDLAVATVVVGEAERHGIGLALAQPVLQEVAFPFGAMGAR
jgi:ornithine cyclodeaminase